MWKLCQLSLRYFSRCIRKSNQDPVIHWISFWQKRSQCIWNTRGDLWGPKWYRFWSPREDDHVLLAYICLIHQELLGPGLGKFRKWRRRSLLCDLVAKTPSSQSREPGFNPWSGNSIPHAATESPHATTNIQWAPIKFYKADLTDWNEDYTPLTPRSK